MAKFNLLVYGFFGAFFFFGAIAARVDAPYAAAIGAASAFALVWGYDVIAGLIVWHLDRYERAAEITAQTAIIDGHLARIANAHGNAGAKRAAELATFQMQRNLTFQESNELARLLDTEPDEQLRRVG